MKDGFTETTNAVAREVPCDAGTVRAYADMGLVPHMRLANGIRLFRPSAAALVREIREKRVDHRRRQTAVEA